MDNSRQKHSCKKKQMLRRREQLLTVDCTAYRAVQLDHNDRLTVEYNINIPAFVVHNPDLRRNALERVRVLLETDLNPTDSIDYQLTGTYVLRNTENNDTCEWVGSFYASLHNPAVLQDFQLFDRHLFVNTVHNLLENVDEQLLYNGRDTKWELTVCSQSSSTFSPPLSKATELSGDDPSNKEEENL